MDHRLLYPRSRVISFMMIRINSNYMSIAALNEFDSYNGVRFMSYVAA
jgi:hypothetical protein